MKAATSMWTKVTGGAVLTLVFCSCERPSTPSASTDAGHPKAPGLGEVMLQVGRRFEVAGRAATANRFDLAAFEVGELEELFEDDVPNAELPKEGPTAQIPGMARTFLQVNVPDLKKAAAGKDLAAFADSFQRVATACNTCHQVAAKGFIQVPTVPGRAVPDLDPVSAPGPAKAP